MTPNAREDYKSVESLSWKPTELQSGKKIKIKTFPKFKKVKLFLLDCFSQQDGICRK